MPATRTLVSKPERLLHLSPQELDAIRSLPSGLRVKGPEGQIRRTGERTTDCVVLLNDIVSSSRPVEGDKRQVTSFYVRGTCRT